MQKIFIDADIILDVLADRRPYYQDAAAIFTLIDQGQILGFTSPIVSANIHYILSRRLSRRKVLHILKKLRTLLNIVPVDDKIIDSALESGFMDYEDSIQYNAAVEAGIPILITRNVKDYSNPAITVCTPSEFLLMWSTQQKK